MQIRYAAGNEDVAGIHEIYAPIIEETAISFETVVPSHDESFDDLDPALVERALAGC